MAGRIVRDDIETLRRQADIVAVVGDYTTLKRAGRSFKGLCPFHTERTPSFHVTPGENFFHCFGCDASGDLYDFLQRIEGLDFPEAVEAVARRTGFTLHYEELTARERRAVGERSRLVAVTAAARDRFRDWLFEEAGTPARDYLKSRGFGRDDAERYELGFAPNRWEELSRTLLADGFSEQDLLTTGLAVRNDRGGLRDRFRGRLIFPIHDPGGDVIGFGGRVLPELDYGDFDPPKYLNSQETPLYRKTRVLYGVPQARADIVRAGQVLICEGYTDVMALAQAGVGNVVATCGTAVGVEHLRAVARYARRVVLAFDGDEAGVRAAERAWDAARTVAGEGSAKARDGSDTGAGGGADLELRVLTLAAGQDPADLVEAVGAEGMQAAVGGGTPVVPLVGRHRLAGAQLDTEAGRTAALRDALEVIGREPDPDLRREWARTEVAPGVGVAYDFVARSAERQGVELDAHEGVATDHGRGSGPGDRGGVARTDRGQARAERAVLRVALQAPELLPDEWYELTDHDFTHPTAKAVHATLAAAGGAGVALTAVLEVAVDDELRGVLRGLALEEDADLDDPEVAGEVAADRVRSLLAGRLRGEERELRDRLGQLNHQRDLDELLELQRRLGELQARRRALTDPAT